MALRSDFTNDTEQVDVHPQHHNDLAQAINELQTAGGLGITGEFDILDTSTGVHTLTMVNNAVALPRSADAQTIAAAPKPRLLIVSGGLLIRSSSAGLTRVQLQLQATGHTAYVAHYMPVPTTDVLFPVNGVAVLQANQSYTWVANLINQADQNPTYTVDGWRSSLRYAVIG